MKPFEKMTKLELIVFVLMAVCSGCVIGIGGAASLLANSLFGDWGRLIGGCLFSLGIFAIVTFEMKLFTGMVADIPTIGIKNSWRLPVCFLGNTLGIGIVALIAAFSPISERIVAQGAATIGGKLNVELWYIKALCSSMLCGALITISVKSVKFAPQKGLSATLGVVFPIVVFAFCGFDHSVANMMYFFYLGEVSWRVVGYILITIVGNIIGGTTLPCVSLLKGKAEKEKKEKHTIAKESE